MAHCVNPFANPIDLTTTIGQKQYDKATKGTPKKHDLTNDMEKAEEFLVSLKSDCRKYCYGPVTTKAEIQIEGHVAGTEVADLLTDHSKISKERVIETAGVIWGCGFEPDNTHDFVCVDSNDDDVNQLRSKSAMLGTYLENSLTEDGKTAMNNYSHLFTYANTDGNDVLDGMTMVHLILNLIMPTAKASGNNKRAELMTMDPSKFDGDITKMITRMQTLKAAIENDSGNPYPDFIMHLFTACTKSKVSDFSSYASRLRSDWEADDDAGTDDQILRKLTKKWNNISTNTEVTKPSTKSTAESNNAKLLVLLTALVNKADGGGNSSNTSSNNSDRRGKRDPQSSIAEWRKTKSHGDSIFKDGKMYYWCEQHQEGKGLYVTHHPKDHGKKIGDWEHTDRSRNVKSQGSNSNGGGASTDGKLQLSDKMKAALTSQGISGTDVDSLISGLKGSNSDGAMDFW